MRGALVWELLPNKGNTTHTAEEPSSIDNIVRGPAWFRTEELGAKGETGQVQDTKGPTAHALGAQTLCLVG